MPVFRDFVPAPIIGQHPELYRLENQALARDRRLDQALARVAPYAGLDVLDLDAAAGWWAARHEVGGGWLAEDAAQLEGILRLEFPDAVVDDFSLRHSGLVHLSYRFAVYTWRP